MYDHTFYKQVQISRSDIRPHIKWAVSLVILHIVTSVFLPGFVWVYIWVNIGPFNKLPLTTTLLSVTLLFGHLHIQHKKASNHSGNNQSVGSSAPVVSRCFPGGYNVKLYISRGRLAWWLLAFLHSDIPSQVCSTAI